MHPRQDVTHHPLVPPLLAAGRGGLDPAHPLGQQRPDAGARAGAARRRGRDGVPARAGFDAIVTLGHSGGGPLFAFYLEQAGLAAAATGSRRTPGGRPTGLADAEMPVADGAVFLAPHPGQGRLLLGCIDPSVADEADPLSVVPELDPFDPANGFAEPPASSSYSAGVPRALPRRAARPGRPHRRRRARAHLARTAEARAAFKRDRGRRRPATGARARRSSRCSAPTPTRAPSTSRSTPATAPTARCSARGPDLINYGQVGFGRLTTPEAWLSTWSGLSSQRRLRAVRARASPCRRCSSSSPATRPRSRPTPAGWSRALGAADLTHGRRARPALRRARSPTGEPTGNELAAERIARVARGALHAVGLSRRGGR